MRWPPTHRTVGGPFNQGPPFAIGPSPGGGGSLFPFFSPYRSTINVRTGPYIWTASGSGTGEFYCSLAAAANPSLGAPILVFINNVQAAQGSALGSLAASEWKYGNNDTLGFNTIYVRLADDTDPDTKANGFVQIVV